MSKTPCVIGKSAYGPGLVFDEYEWAVEKKQRAGKAIWWAELGLRDRADAPRDCLDVVKKLDQRFPELAGFNFWSDEGHYNVVGNRNGKKLMADPRIITLNSRDKLKLVCIAPAESRSHPGRVRRVGRVLARTASGTPRLKRFRAPLIIRGTDQPMTKSKTSHEDPPFQSL